MKRKVEFSCGAASNSLLEIMFLLYRFRTKLWFANSTKPSLRRKFILEQPIYLQVLYIEARNSIISTTATPHHEKQFFFHHVSLSSIFNRISHSSSSHTYNSIKRQCLFASAGWYWQHWPPAQARAVPHGAIAKEHHVEDDHYYYRHHSTQTPVECLESLSVVLLYLSSSQI